MSGQKRFSSSIPTRCCSIFQWAWARSYVFQETLHSSKWRNTDRINSLLRGRTSKRGRNFKEDFNIQIPVIFFMTQGCTSTNKIAFGILKRENLSLWIISLSSCCGWHYPECSEVQPNPHNTPGQSCSPRGFPSLGVWGSEIFDMSYELQQFSLIH